MFMSGFVLVLSMVFLFIKLPRRMMFWLLGHALALDIFVTMLMTVIHWGTFTGLMAAAFAGLLCSIATTTARKLFGYTEGKRFVPGIFTVKE